MSGLEKAMVYIPQIDVRARKTDASLPFFDVSLPFGEVKYRRRCNECPLLSRQIDSYVGLSSRSLTRCHKIEACFALGPDGRGLSDDCALGTGLAVATIRHPISGVLFAYLE
jgi:hypothetical protein